mmetsp:Transcript_18654/g.35895  ORF Transcript_18654/g.35895 Transcript_18654/m.35895 type:complete len:452 (-) Transcript_18654:324-1679(-)
MAISTAVACFWAVLSFAVVQCDAEVKFLTSHATDPAMRSNSWAFNPLLLRAKQPELPTGKVLSFATTPGRCYFKELLAVAFVSILAASWIRQRSMVNRDIKTEKDPLARDLRLPTQQAAAAPPPQPSILRACLVLLAWMSCSTGFILYNKWMFTTGGFPYPMTLTAMHMGSCYLIFGCFSWLPQHIRRRFMPDIDKAIPTDIYLQGLLPAALLMAMSLGIGNLGFLYASVAFIQMIKPVNVVVTSIAGFVWGLEVFTPSHAIIACVVSFGVSMAAFGSISNFSYMGLACQLTASVCEGLRLILLQGVLQGRLRLDPLTTVYRFAPSAGLWLCCVSLVFEGDVAFAALPNMWVLPLNCLVAVLLNVLIVSVIAETSAVVFVLAGVTKDIATIALSVCLYGTPIRAVEIVGYSTSVAGICLYKVYKDHLQLFKELGFLRGMATVCGKKLGVNI